MNEQNIEVDVEIDLAVLATRLVNNPAFINAVRTALLKDARRLGNLFGNQAQVIGTQTTIPSAQVANTTRPNIS